MRQKFTEGFVNAADGEWGPMATDDVSLREQPGQRLRRRARTALVLTLVAGGMFTATANPFGLSSGGTSFICTA
ncbi:hypothetical protein GCM10023205_27950 [Yinghuangia aomiensis]|uniref:Uncharacterized protein n=1 Tax=Yinghuangia aomiensis TaxID=676205 RepID=A0ABP9H6Z0_9ACTN